MQDLPSKPASVQLALFRVALGPDARKLLRNQPVARNQDGTERDKALVKMMEMAVIDEVKRFLRVFIFHSRVQNEGESLDDLMTLLRELIKTCDVTPDKHDRLLKYQMILTVRDAHLREKLMQERGPDSQQVSGYVSCIKTGQGNW